MMVKHISIEVTSKQTKKPVFGGPADLTAYILEPVDGILDKKRPAVLLCPGGGYRTLSTREDQPIAMKYLAAGFHVFVLHYSLAPETLQQLPTWFHTSSACLQLRSLWSAQVRVMNWECQ